MPASKHRIWTPQSFSGASKLGVLSIIKIPQQEIALGWQFPADGSKPHLIHNNRGVFFFVVAITKGWSLAVTAQLLLLQPSYTVCRLTKMVARRT
jgi:hypothetical protein